MYGIELDFLDVWRLFERMGRIKEFPHRITLPLTETMMAELDASLREGESRVELVRTAIDREIRRRSPFVAEARERGISVSEDLGKHKASSGRVLRDHADRDSDTQTAVSNGVRRVIDEAISLGWTEKEAAEAIIAAAEGFLSVKS